MVIPTLVTDAVHIGGDSVQRIDDENGIRIVHTTFFADVDGRARARCYCHRVYHLPGGDELVQCGIASRSGSR